MVARGIVRRPDLFTINDRRFKAQERTEDEQHSYTKGRAGTHVGKGQGSTARCIADYEEGADVEHGDDDTFGQHDIGQYSRRNIDLMAIHIDDDGDIHEGNGPPGNGRPLQDIVDIAR